MRERIRTTLYILVLGRSLSLAKQYGHEELSRTPLQHSGTDNPTCAELKKSYAQENDSPSPEQDFREVEGLTSGYVMQRG